MALDLAWAFVSWSQMRSCHGATANTNQDVPDKLAKGAMTNYRGITNHLFNDEQITVYKKLKK